MISTDVVKVLDFIDSDDPVLTCECLFYRVKDRADFGHFGASDSVYCLSWWKERVVVVVRHFVPNLFISLVKLETWFAKNLH